MYPFCICCYYYYFIFGHITCGISVSRPGMETIKAPAVKWRVLTIEMREVPVFVNQKELGAPSFKLSWCFTHACNFGLITPYLTISVCVFIYLSLYQLEVRAPLIPFTCFFQVMLTVPNICCIDQGKQSSKVAS